MTPVPVTLLVSDRLLAQRGDQLREPRSKGAGRGFLELRGHQVRLFYMFLPGWRAVLLEGMIKKVGRIPGAVMNRLSEFQQAVLRREREAGTR